MPEIKRREMLKAVGMGAAAVGLASTAQAQEGRRMKPNVLFLMVDQMQGRVLDPNHLCRTPNLDKLAQRGVRFTRAYAANAVCSPSRASLMTGLLPHNHGMTQVSHCTFDDESVLRTDKPHWAQSLQKAGYHTGYFGKWHVERSLDLNRFGWDVDGETQNALYKRHRQTVLKGKPAKPELLMSGVVEGPEGYEPKVLYGVTEQPVEERMLGMTCHLAKEFLSGALDDDEPWCCFVSVIEPHDPFIAKKEFYGRYDVDALPLPPNWNDDLKDKPGLYRKCVRAFDGLSERKKKEAATCYYASITEIDEEYGRIVDMVDAAGQLSNTIVVFTSDHGECLGAHRMFTKNVGAYEEAYNIPLIASGPGIAQRAVTDARVGIHDICPTLLELTGQTTFGDPDSRSFVSALQDPGGTSGEFQTGFAEYTGSRYVFTQRVVWDGPWKLVWNGFDFDELYNLDDDPYELRNLADVPVHQDQLKRLMRLAWRRVEETGDTPLLNSQYYSLRLAAYGPSV